MYHKVRSISIANTTQSAIFDKAVSDLSSMLTKGTCHKNKSLNILYQDAEGMTGYYTLKGERFAFSFRNSELSVVA